MINTLKEHLKSRRKTQKELADYLCVTPLTVNNWCKGKHKIDIEMAFKIAEFLKTDVNALFLPFHIVDSDNARFRRDRAVAGGLRSKEQ